MSDLLPQTTSFDSASDVRVLADQENSKKRLEQDKIVSDARMGGDGEDIAIEKAADDAAAQESRAEFEQLRRRIQAGDADETRNNGQKVYNAGGVKIVASDPQAALDLIGTEPEASTEEILTGVPLTAKEAAEEWEARNGVGTSAITQTQSRFEPIPQLPATVPTPPTEQDSTQQDHFAQAQVIGNAHDGYSEDEEENAGEVPASSQPDLQQALRDKDLISQDLKNPQYFTDLMEEDERKRYIKNQGPLPSNTQVLEPQLAIPEPLQEPEFTSPLSKIGQQALRDQDLISQDLKNPQYFTDLMEEDERNRYIKNQGPLPSNTPSTPVQFQPPVPSVTLQQPQPQMPSDTGSEVVTQAGQPEAKPGTPEQIQAQAELILAITQLTIAIEHLKATFPNDPQIQIIANNILIGTGNIIGGQTNVAVGEGIQQSNTIGGGITASAENTTVTTDGTQEDKEKKPGEEEKTPVDRLEDLNKERDELKKKLEDPNLTPEEKKAIEDSIAKLDIVIEKTEDKVGKDQEEAAKDVTDLPEEEKEELKEAGKKKDGFVATITRMFKGKKWKTLLTSSLISGGAGLLMSKSLAVATVAIGGPVGAAVIGIGLAALGGYTAFKTIRKVKETADNQGVSWKELVKDRRFLTGAVVGSVISGVSKIAAPMLVPGLGGFIAPLLGSGVEIGIMAMQERNLNKEQEALVNKYLTTYEARRYNKLKELGYLSREGVNIEKIVADMSDANLSTDEKKTAQKAAIASLSYMYEQTKDEKYRFLHYTVKENGVDVKKEIDITSIGVKPRQGSTPDYELLDLEGINFETIADTLDVAELGTLTLEASQHPTFTDRKALTNILVTKFVGIESADVETLLSSDREHYFQSVALAAGYRTGIGVMSSLAVIHAGGSMAVKAFETMAASTGTAATSPVEDRYRTELGDSDAEVRTFERPDGTRVNAVDLDGDNTPDLIHNPATNEFVPKTLGGAEKLFEIQHPGAGDVTSSTFGSSTTGISGTLVDGTGNVVGVTYTDANGNIGLMDSSQLSSGLNATLTGGGAAAMTIGAIQPNGDMALNIGGTEYTTNLSTLQGIPATEGIPGTLGSDPLLTSVQPGESVPSILDKILQQVKPVNPGLADADPHALQRSLYSNHLPNDSAVRAELGFSNPVQTGEEYNVRNSPTVLGWLENLNGGPVTLPDATGGAGGVPGSDGINFGFNGPLVNDIPLDGLAPVEIPTEATMETPYSYLAGTALMGLAAFTPYEIGGIARSAKVDLFPVEQGDVEQGENEEPPVVAPVPPLTPEQEKAYINQILRTQVFTYTKEGKIKVAAGSTFDLNGKKLVATDSGWLLDDQPIGKEIAEVDKIVAAFFTITEREKQAEVLVALLDKMTVQNGVGRRITLATGVRYAKQTDGTWKQVNPVRNADRNPGDPDTREILTSQQLADKILLIKRDESKQIVGSIVPPTPIGTTTQTTTGQGTVQGQATTTGSNNNNQTTGVGGTSATATVETTSNSPEAGQKEQKDPFKESIRSVLKAAQNSAKKQITVNGANYTWDPVVKMWNYAKNQTIPASEALSDDQAVYLYTQNLPGVKKANTTLLLSDIEATLKAIDTYDLEILVGKDTFKRVGGTNNNFLWKSDKQVGNDKQIAHVIVNLKPVEAAATATTEQAEGTVEQETKEKKSKWRKVLKGALIAIGVGGGVVAGVYGVGLATAGFAGGAGLINAVARWGLNRSKESLQKKNQEISKRVKASTEGKYTPDQKAESDTLDKKIKRRDAWLEVCSHVSYLTTPLAITSLAMGVLEPVLTDIGFQAWVKGAINKIGITTTSTPLDTGIDFNIGTK